MHGLQPVARLVFLLGSVQVAAPAIAAQVPPPRLAAPVELNLPVTLDGRYLGDMLVRINDSVISFDAQRFISLVESDLTAPAIAKLRDRISDGRLTPELATTSEVSVRYDPALQEIAVVSVSSARERRIIDSRPGISEDRSALERPENVSLFINGAIAYEHVIEDRADPANEGRAPLSGTIDFGGRVGGDQGIAFISRHAYQEDGIREFTRLESQLIYDDVERLLRVTAGDLRYRGSNFQTLPRVAGVSVERFFGLEPTRIFRPVGETAFDLERPSTVQVRINGLDFQQLYLPPGRYDLRDLPLTQGANDVELVIRDDTGREYTISRRSFFDFDLLEPGLSDFSFAGGVRSRFLNGSIDYSDDWVFSGFYRRGLSPVLTAGADIQFDREGGTVGAAAVWASPFGVWRTQMALSHRDGFGSGVAAGLGYLATGRLGREWRWTGRVSAEYQSKNFTTLNDVDPLEVDAILRRTATRVAGNFQINNQRLTITADGQFEQIRGAPDRVTALVGATYRVRPNLTVGLFGRHQEFDGRSDTGFFVQLTWRPGRNRLVRASYDSIRGDMDVSYRYSPPPVVGTTAYEIGIRRNTDVDQLNITGRVSHVGNRFEASAQHDVFSTADFGSSERVQVSRVSVASSLVFAGGRFQVARPVREGFAIVSRHPSLADKTVLVDPTESGVRARTDFLGSAVVPDLPSYNRTSLYVDVVDLPPGYDLGSGQFGLRAPLYAGYDLTVGSGASVTLLGTVVRANGEPVALVGGSMVSLSDPNAEPIPVFTNRNGRLAGVGFRPGRYRLTLLTTPEYSTEIEIPEGATSLVNIGEIRVTQP